MWTPHQQRGLCGRHFLAAGAVLLVVAQSIFSEGLLSFVSAPTGTHGLLARGTAVDSATARSVYWRWVEPTVPEELVESAKEEGFRLRPTYSHMKIGYVVSDKQKKTRVALIEYYLFNAKYGGWYKRSKKKHFHDEYELSKLGDVVLIAPYRKRSNMKWYRLIEVMRKNDAPEHV
ncbi:unnamed protein product [Cladocopium goreaui]|uniref:Protein-tyrosine-phosphatase MKP1 n=1 Tax=Cladocopium goreaui TaxID=2562237 RepID=A0A9P1FYN9_9DINO|nr:unnamed protein product [Cladocopium goreaui]CAI3991535.1 unnamed protein product [Cladocopium goreaui]